MSRLDVVVFGASGLTGRRAAERLAGLAAARGLRWALAGRSQEKLRRVLKEISDKTGKDVSSTPVIIADVQNEQSIVDMCGQAKVVMNCCGPYALYGEVVVRAAIRRGTHYVDVSGEPNFIEMTQLKYGQAARDAGVYVVSACGFTSIPADLGVVYMQQNFEGVLNSVECYLTTESLLQSINYTSWHSFVYSFSKHSELIARRKQLYTTPLPKLTPKLKSRSRLHKHNNGWCLPFPSQDCSAVYRTQRYFHSKEGTRPAQFKAYLKSNSFWIALATALTFTFIYIMSQFEITRNLLLKHSSIFSLGLVKKAPSKNVVEKVRFELDLYGNGWDEKDAANIANLPPRKSVILKVSGSNPAYGMTVTGLLYSAVAILEEPHNMPPGGGVLTAGVAFAKTNLIKNLQDNEVAFCMFKDNCDN